MKWETDLIKDIRSNTIHDDTESGINLLYLKVCYTLLSPKII